MKGLAWIFLPTLSEFIGTLFYVFLSGAVIQITGLIDTDNVNPTRCVVVALTDGFLYLCMIYVTMRLSSGQGGYFNPAVTIALLPLDVIETCLDNRAWTVSGTSTHKVWWLPLYRTLFFLGAQLAGALCGTMLLTVALPDVQIGVDKYGSSVRAAFMTWGDAFILNMLLATFLVFVILSVRINEERRSSIIIGFVFICVSLVAFPLSGAGSLNPAGLFGPAVITRQYQDFGMNIISPCVGALVALVFFVFFRYSDIVPSDRTL